MTEPMYKKLLTKKKKKKKLFKRGDLSKEHEFPEQGKAAYSLAVGHNGEILHHTRFVGS